MEINIRHFDHVEEEKEIINENVIQSGKKESRSFLGFRIWVWRNLSLDQALKWWIEKNRK